MSSHDLVARWAIASIVLGFAAQAYMFVWLWRRGARPTIYLANTPTHLHRVYHHWCAEQGRRPGWLMPVTAVSVYASLVAFFLAF